MPRIARGLADGFIYHVLNRGNGKQKIFHTNSDYRAFIRLLKEGKSRYSVKIFAYCLMPNHFHLVMMPIMAKDLSHYMHWIMTSHVRRYHAYYKSSGHIWQGRFKSFIVQEDSHLLTVLRYIEGNPIRAGLVKTAKDWMWSSYRESTDIRLRSLTDHPPIELPKDWARFVNEPLAIEEIATLRNSVIRATPYGISAWQEKISKALGLESTLKPRGRPRKTARKE